MPVDPPWFPVIIPELADREGRCEVNGALAAFSSCRAAGVAIGTPMTRSKLSATTCFVEGTNDE